MQFCMDEAKGDKEWAVAKEKELGSRDWVGASELSKQMLISRLDSTVEELALGKFSYMKMRATAYGSHNYWIAPDMHKLYLKKSGMGESIKVIHEHYKLALLWAEDLDSLSTDAVPSHYELPAIEKFLHMAGDMLEEWDDEQIGHDLYLTRAGHGAGFWDRRLAYSDELSELCTSLMSDLDVIRCEDNTLEITVHNKPIGN